MNTGTTPQRKRSRLRRAPGVLLFLALGVGACWPWPWPRASPRAVLHTSSESTLWGFSPDGRLLATTAQPGPLEVWDVHTGRLCWARPAEADEPASPDGTFSPDSRWLVLDTRNGKLEVWNLQTGRRIHFPPPPNYDCAWGEMLADGRTLVHQHRSLTTAPFPASRDLIRLWDMVDQRERGTLDRSLSWIGAAPDGRTLVTLAVTRKPPRLMLWRLPPEGGPPIFVSERPVPAAHDVVEFSDDRRMFVSIDPAPRQGQAARVLLGDVMQGRQSRLVLPPEVGNGITGLEFTTSGKRLIVRSGELGRAWDLTVGPPRLLATFPYPVDGRLSADGELLAVPLAKWSAVELRETLTGRVRAVLDVLSQPNFRRQRSLELSPDGSLLVLTGTIRVGYDSSAAHSAGAQLAHSVAERLHLDSGPMDVPVARVWSTKNGRELMLLTDCKQAWLSPDGRTLAACQGREVSLWDMPPGPAIPGRLLCQVALGGVLVLVIGRRVWRRLRRTGGSARQETCPA